MLSGRRLDYLQLFNGHFMGLGQAGEQLEHGRLGAPCRQLPARLLQAAVQFGRRLNAVCVGVRQGIDHQRRLRHQRP
nr:hypothetical protein [Pseudomonas sp. BIGb0427]